MNPVPRDEMERQIVAALCEAGCSPGTALSMTRLAMIKGSDYERERCMTEADRLRSNATCGTVKKVCKALIDRIRKGD